MHYWSLYAITIVIIIFILVIAIMKSAAAECTYCPAAGPPVGSAIWQVLANRDHVYVFWAENTNGSEYSPWLRVSTDGGKTFGSVTDLSNVTGNTDRVQNAKLAVPADNKVLYLTWTNKTTSDNIIYHPKPLFTRSLDNGKSFGKPVNLAANYSLRAGTGGFGINTVQTAGDSVFVLLDCLDACSPYGGLSFIESQDRGRTFGNITELFAWPEMSQDYGQMAHSSNGKNVYVISAGSSNYYGVIGIPFRSSNDGGVTFSQSINLNAGSKNVVTGPVIAASGNDNVYVAWSEFDPANMNLVHVYVRSSNDGGKTFGPKVMLDNATAAASGQQINFVQIAANQNTDNVYVMWWNTLNQVYHLLVRASNDSGMKFAAPVELTPGAVNPSGNSQNKSAQYISDLASELVAPVSLDDGNGNTSTIAAKSVYATWIANVGQYPDAMQSKVFVKSSTDAGNSFDTLKALPEQASNPAQNTKSAASGNNVYIAWDNGSPGVHGLYFAKSNDNGNSFSTINLDASPHGRVQSASTAVAMPYSVSAQFNGHNYTLSGYEWNLTIHSFRINPGKSISIDVTGQNGRLQITMPKSLMNGSVSAVTDSDGRGLSADIYSLPDCCNTPVTYSANLSIGIVVPNATHGIEISSNNVVPEFSNNIALSTAAISVAGVLALRIYRNHRRIRVF